MATSPLVGASPLPLRKPHPASNSFAESALDPCRGPAVLAAAVAAALYTVLRIRTRETVGDWMDGPPIHARKGAVLH